MPHWTRVLRAIGGEAAPTPATSCVVNDIERLCARLALVVCSVIVVERTPAQVPLAMAAWLYGWCELGQQVERGDVRVDPAG